MLYISFYTCSICASLFPRLHFIAVYLRVLLCWRFKHLQWPLPEYVVRAAVILAPVAGFSKSDWDDGRCGNCALRFPHTMSPLEPSNWFQNKRVQACILTYNARGINTLTACRRQRVFNEWFWFFFPSFWVTLFQSPQNGAHAASSKNTNSWCFGPL